MSRERRIATTVLAGLMGIAGIAVTASLAFAGGGERREVNGTIWVANRGAHTIGSFDAATGDAGPSVAMRPGCQPGDLAYAKGKLYVAEEFGTPPAIAVVDATTGEILNRIFMPTGSRPHHVHASVGGNLVAFGLYGTDMVAVIDTHMDTLLGTWHTNPATTNGRAHAAVFSKDSLYVASDATNEIIALDPLTGEIQWRLDVPNAHELEITHDGKTAYVAGRTGNAIRILDLEQRVITSNVSFPAGSLPDTLRLSANEKLLTVGLRASPAQVAIVDTATMEYELVQIGEPGTIAGHQWTSPNGHFTFASFEGPGAGVAVIDHTAGNIVVQTIAYPGRPHGVDLART